MVDMSLNGIIRVHRGDSFKFPLFLNQGSEINPVRYILNENDQVFFALTEPNQPFENAIVKKVLTYQNLNPIGDAIIQFTPKDTECLIPGKYYYEIKARLCDTHILLDYTVNIRDDNSKLKRGTKLTKGSKINGKPVESSNLNEIIKVNENYYQVINEVNLSEYDKINYGSFIKAGSTLNGYTYESDYIINTVVKRTEFWIE